MKIILKLVNFFKKSLPFLVFGLIIGLAVYFLKPLKKKVSLFPMEVFEGKVELSCETKVGAVIFPKPNWEDKPLGEVEAEISTGGSKIAIEIGEKTVKFLTSTSVEVGMMEPAEFTILSNDDKSLVAVLYDDSAGIAESKVIDSFILNKKSGFAVWTKSRDSFFISDNPDSQVYYLRCY